jgi:HEAT repeat protein
MNPQSKALLNAAIQQQDIESLIDALRYDDSRRIASAALAQIGAIALLPLFEVLKTSQSQNQDDLETEETYKWVHKTLYKIGEPALLFLLENLKSEDTWDRAIAANALGYINDVRAIDPLINLLEDEDMEVRASAIWALGLLGDPRAIVPITNFNVAGTSTGSIAFQALEKIRKVEQLIEIFKTGDNNVRLAVTTALGLFGDKRALPALRWLKQHTTDQVIAEAVRDAVEQIQERERASD